MNKPLWENDEKMAISFKYKSENYILKKGNIITFRFLNYKDLKQNIKISKGKIFAFGWSRDSPPHYIIVNLWDSENKIWGQKRCTVKIPGWDTGRAISGELVLN
jgi:hypothetical protein